MSQLLFPACPENHLVPSVVQYFLQEPPERLQMRPAVWMSSVSLRNGFASALERSHRAQKHANTIKRAPALNAFEVIVMGGCCPHPAL